MWTGSCLSCVSIGVPPRKPDAGTDRLLLGEAAYLLASGRAGLHNGLSFLVRELAATLGRKFGSFLIVEIWSAERESDGVQQDALELTPSFTILARRTGGLTSVIERLEAALRRVKVQRKRSVVDVVEGARVAPPGMKPLLSKSQAAELGRAAYWR